MHGNEVVDLQSFRNADAAGQDANDTTSQYLPNGTTLLVGQYVIDGYLNCGGFGITYTAHDSLGRKVVIKECFPAEMVYRRGKQMIPRSSKYRGELADIVRNFVVEAHSLARLKHDNIVHVHQIFEENGTAYMAMDYIEGADLLDIVESGRKLTPRQIETLTRKTLEAIRYVHAMGMLHRDISPDNILVDRSGEPVLIDFGAAHRHAQQAAHGPSRMKFVKDGYSPQEFYIAGSGQGTYSDLYSFAASIYHVISGTAPADAQTRLAEVAAKRPDPYNPLSGRIPGFRPRFLSLIDRALSVAPEDRIQTADAWLLRMPADRSSAASRVFAPATAVLESLSIFDSTSAVKATDGMGQRKMLFASGLAGLALLIGAGAVLTRIGDPAVPAEDSFADSARLIVEETPSNLVRLAKLAQPSPLVSVWPEGFASGLADSRPEAEVALGKTQNAVPPALAMPAGRAGPEIFLPEAAGQRNVFEFAAPAIERDPGPSRYTSVVRPRLSTSERLATYAMPNPPGKPGLDATHSPGRNQLRAQPLDVALTAIAPVALSNKVTLLPNPPEANRITIDTMAPAYSPRTPERDIAASFSRWEVEIPFTAEARQSGDVYSLVVTGVAPGAERSLSGEWVAEGVTIVAVNEIPLKSGLTLAEHLLDTLEIGPDGLARASVWYRKPDEDVLDQGTLSVPVMRITGLADGTVLETRMQGESWVTSVKSLGSADTDLQPGDLIVGNSRTHTRFADHQSVELALNALAQSGATAAEFAVLRNGQRLTANWRLAGQ